MSVSIVGIVTEADLIRRPTTSDDLAPDYVKAYGRRAVNRGREGGDDAR